VGPADAASVLRTCLDPGRNRLRGILSHSRRAPGR
jgi:hypothetical protein